MFTWPTGSGIREMVPPHLAKKYKAATKIKTLVITEGNWKSLVSGELFEFNLYGIPGINNWGPKNTKAAFPTLLKIIDRCKVKNVIFLVDADAFDVEWREGKDLYRRPENFRRALFSFKEKLSDTDVFLQFAWIKKEYQCKGIDDLLIKYADKSKAIIRDICKIAGNCKYVEKVDVTSMPYTRS